MNHSPDSKLLSLLEQAQSLKAAHPNVAIVLLGIGCEQLTREILLHKGCTNTHHLEHYERLLLLEQYHAPREIIDILHKIRLLRNQVLHQALEIPIEKAEDIMTQTKILTKWYSELFASHNIKIHQQETLHDAMVIVLSECSDYILHTKHLSEEIYTRKLYLKKDGTQAKPDQIRARANKYPHLFEILPQSMIRLRK